MPDLDDDKYWYNTKTGQVEHGMVSPSAERAGPYDTAEEAAKAPDRIRENSRRWANED
jgi:hypothetical protein